MDDYQEGRLSLAEYEAKLVSQFKENFQKFNVSQSIVEAGPR